MALGRHSQVKKKLLCIQPTQILYTSPSKAIAGVWIVNSFVGLFTLQQQVLQCKVNMYAILTKVKGMAVLKPLLVFLSYTGVSLWT